MENKILGVLYGMAMGDAMGMPPELWMVIRKMKSHTSITGVILLMIHHRRSRYWTV